MSSKKLLNESQVRQFMKLAKLEPLSKGFVHGLTELRTGRTGALGPKGGPQNPGHGRGQGEAADGSLFEDEDLEAQDYDLEDDAEHDIDRADDLEDDAAEDLADVGVEDDSPSEQELLDALQVIARAAGLEGLDMEVSGDVEDEVAVEDDVEMDVELPVDDVDDVEMEDEMLEEQGKKTISFGDGEGSNIHVDKKELAQNAEKPVAGTVTAKELTDFVQAHPPKKDTEVKKEGADEDTDDLVEQITKRVAARILKSALAKK